MASSVSSYRDLKVWVESMVLAEDVYRLSERFPKAEVYGLTVQLRRAAVSIASNIAEGHGRETSAHFVHFLRIAQGSLKELETQLILSQRLALADGAQAEAALAKCDELGRMLRGLIRSIQRKSQRDA